MARASQLFIWRYFLGWRTCFRSATHSKKTKGKKPAAKCFLDEIIKNQGGDDCGYGGDDQKPHGFAQRMAEQRDDILIKDQQHGDQGAEM